MPENNEEAAFRRPFRAHPSFLEPGADAPGYIPMPLCGIAFVFVPTLRLESRINGGLRCAPPTLQPINSISYAAERHKKCYVLVVLVSNLGIVEWVER